MSNAEIELGLLNEYLDAALKTDQPGAAQKLALYEKQLSLCKSQGISFNDTWCEAMIYYVKANQKLSTEGLVEKTLRSTARESSGFDGLAPALFAKEREAGRIREAISFLDKAIGTYADDVDFWMLRASLHDALNNKQAALRDVNYVLANYSDNQKVYVAARKLKDEIETVKSKDCFIATAVYESPDTMELTILRDYRDQVLLRNSLGRVMVAFYYRCSPRIARLIGRSAGAKRTIRIFLLDPIVRSIEKANTGN